MKNAGSRLYPLAVMFIDNCTVLEYQNRGGIRFFNEGIQVCRHTQKIGFSSTMGLCYGAGEEASTT